LYLVAIDYEAPAVPRYQIQRFLCSRQQAPKNQNSIHILSTLPEMALQVIVMVYEQTSLFRGLRDVPCEISFLSLTAYGGK
jgi:hypothetical protein